MTGFVAGWVLLVLSWWVSALSRHPLRHQCSVILAFGALLFFAGSMFIR